VSLEPETVEAAARLQPVADKSAPEAKPVALAGADHPTPDRRRRLSNRREHRGEGFAVGSIEYHVGVGPSNDGLEVGEIFLTGPKQGSAAAAFAEDCGTMASILLQLGMPLEHLAARLARDGVTRQALLIAAELAKASP